MLLMMFVSTWLWGQEQVSSPPGAVDGHEATEAVTPESQAARAGGFLSTPEAIKAAALSSAAQHTEESGKEPNETVDEAVQMAEPEQNVRAIKKIKKAKARSLRRNARRVSRRGKKAAVKPPVQSVEAVKFESTPEIVPLVINSDTERLLDALADEAASEFESITVLQQSAKEQPKQQLKPDIWVDPLIQKIELMPQINGMEVPEQLVDSTPLVSGDRLLFTLRCSNQGSAAAERLVITYPLPPGVVYSPDSAMGEETTILYSVDGGYSFAQFEYLQLQDKNHKVTPADDDITHVRWVHHVAFEVGQSGVLTFEGVFR